MGATMNNEFVSVPRDQLKRAADRLSDMGQAPISEPLFKLMNDQHQGELVAWVRVIEGEPAQYSWFGNKQLPVGKHRLYTHADTGEVERLREGISKHWKVVCDQRAELDTLRAQLAERDALLHEVLIYDQSQRVGDGYNLSALLLRIESAMERKPDQSREVLQKLRWTICLPRSIETDIDEALKS